MQSPYCVSDLQIAEAERIETYDEETMGGFVLWGQDLIARGRAPGSSAYLRKCLEVVLPEEDRVGLIEFVDRINMIRGRLPIETQRLRKRVAAEFAVG